jgi:hypothetical protein
LRTVRNVSAAVSRVRGRRLLPRGSWGRQRWPCQDLPVGVRFPQPLGAGCFRRPGSARVSAALGHVAGAGVLTCDTYRSMICKFLNSTNEGPVTPLWFCRPMCPGPFSGCRVRIRVAAAASALAYGPPSEPRHSGRQPSSSTWRIPRAPVIRMRWPHEASTNPRRVVGDCYAIRQEHPMSLEMDTDRSEGLERSPPDDARGDALMLAVTAPGRLGPTR